MTRGLIGRARQGKTGARPRSVAISLGGFLHEVWSALLKDLLEIARKDGGPVPFVAQLCHRVKCVANPQAKLLYAVSFLTGADGIRESVAAQVPHVSAELFSSDIIPTS